MILSLQIVHSLQSAEALRPKMGIAFMFKGISF